MQTENRSYYIKPCFSSSEPDLKFEENEVAPEKSQVIQDNDQAAVSNIIVDEAKHSSKTGKETPLKAEEVEIAKEAQDLINASSEKCAETSVTSGTLDASTTEDEPMDAISAANLNESVTEELEGGMKTPCSTPSSKIIEGKLLEGADVTPKKTLSPKQLQKRLESEKKRKQKQLEREERERKKQEEKEEKLRFKQELQKQKQEKEELKKKEREEKEKQKKMEREEKELQKKKEREEKEQKRREKEEREEQKRKEKEQERLKKQQEIEEKNREKQKQEEQKQKAAAAFANFFVPLKTETEEKKPATQTAFMPFEVKSDMRLAPITRNQLTEIQKENLISIVHMQDASAQTYLKELKSGRTPRKSNKTWSYIDPSDDVVIVEEDVTLGERVYEEKPKMEKMRAKFLKFHENQRPPYYGTWRKKSKAIKPKRPLVKDKAYFDYEVDSDDDWEEEEQGESITGSDGEDKENESENEYEVDNEFFVPHGHLSEDEVDDEETNRLSPESQKAKLKLLKNEFEEEMKSKMQKIKPRVIGCIWYKKEGKVDEAIDRFLQPLAIITNKPITIRRRDDPDFQNGIKKKDIPTVMEPKLIPTFLELIHGSTKNKKALVKEYLAYLKNKQVDVSITKSLLIRSLKRLAQWVKCPEEGPLLDKYCWYVSHEVRNKHGVTLGLPNKWEFTTNEDEAM